MVAFNFPAGASSGQEYTAPNGTVYQYDGQKWNVKSTSLASVATSGSYTDLSDTPEQYKFNVGADDSVVREVSNGETITFKGSDGITTSSDDEGNITIQGGIVEGQTYEIDIVGNVFDNNSNQIIDRETGIVTADVKGSVFADDSQVVVDGITGSLFGNLTGNVTGDVTGSIFTDASTQVVDGHSGSVTANKLTTTDQNVYFGDPEVARIRVHETSSTGTNPFDVFLFRASEYRSMKILVQASNTTDNTFYITELLCLHDGTDAYTSEYSTIFTSDPDPDITLVAILNNGNFILRVTPQLNVDIDYKFIIQTIRT